jgi:hypothetical protein
MKNLTRSLLLTIPAAILTLSLAVTQAAESAKPATRAAERAKPATSPEATKASGAPAVTKQTTATEAAPTHKMMAPDAIEFAPAPPMLPAGVQLAVLTGDPGKEGPFTVRLKMPDGYRVPPHWHPTDELVTVIAGTLHLAMGSEFDETAGVALPAGGFALLPKTMRHYAWSTGETIVQVHGNGPFAITYVNPKDDPRTTTPVTSK